MPLGTECSNTECVSWFRLSRMVETNILVDRCGTAGSSLNPWCGRLRAGTRTMYIEPVGHMWNPSEMSRLSLPYQVGEVDALGGSPRLWHFNIVVNAPGAPYV